MSKDTGGPAFPTDSAGQVGNNTWHFDGMTLRDYFAAHCGVISLDHSWEDEAKARYAYADAMLKERAK
jgi:hypothetical protein